MNVITDKEIIECAENCIRENPSCISCPFDEDTYTADECMGKLIAKLVDVNNRQKAEIEGFIAGQESLQKDIKEKNEIMSAQADKIRLLKMVLDEKTAEVERLKTSLQVTLCEEIHNKAIKEFAERLKAEFGRRFGSANYTDICNLVKEITEGK